VRALSGGRGVDCVVEVGGRDAARDAFAHLDSGAHVAKTNVALFMAH
jgi:hypothetical protein